MPTPPANRDKLLANVGLAVMVLLGGGFFPVLERQLQSWDSLSATAARQIVGGVALCLVLAVRERHPPWPRGVAWTRLLLLSLVGMGLGSVLVSWAIAYSDGVSAAIVSAANPIMAALIARLVYHLPMPRAVAAGAVLAVAGGVIAILGDGRGEVVPMQHVVRAPGGRGHEEFGRQHDDADADDDPPVAADDPASGRIQRAADGNDGLGGRIDGGTGRPPVPHGSE